MTPAEWLGAVWNMWQQNQPVATVMLRSNWGLIDAPLLEAYSDPAFLRTARCVTAHRGDPPVTPEQRAVARALIHGQAPAGADGVLKPLADRSTPFAAVALALSRADLLRFQKQLPPAQDPDTLGDLIDTAFACYTDDPERTDTLLVQAMEGQTGGGAIIPLQTVLNRNDRTPSPEVLRACAAKLIELTQVSDAPDMVAMLLVVCGSRAGAADLGHEMFEPIAAATEGLIDRVIDDDVRRSVTIQAAQYWMQLGRLDRSDELLHRLRALSPRDAATGLETANFEANVRGSCDDLIGATRVLLAALDEHGEAAPLPVHVKAVLTLLANWPILISDDGTPPRPARPGVETWVAEAERLIAQAASWAVNPYKMQLVSALVKLGLVDEAKRIHATLDYGAGEAVSPDFAAWRQDARSWADRRLTDAAASGDDGKDFADLGLEQRFPEAAAEAEAQAALSLARGLRINAFGGLASAAQFYMLAGDDSAALDAFKRAFDLLDHDLQYIPYADLVVSRLASWPDRYLLAAFAALRAGEPLTAVSMAETGRARATGSRLGAVGSRPPQVAPEEWDHFVDLWRRAVAQAANELVAISGWSGQAVSEAVAAELTDLRRTFVSRGVRVEQLSPVGRPVDASSFAGGLRRAPRPTAILYSLRLSSGLRFIRIDAGGATQLRLPPDAQKGVTGAVDRMTAAVQRSGTGTTSPPWRDLVADLLDEAGPALDPMLSAATEGLAGGRLIWIPQGSLAALPIPALPCAGGLVIDRVAVMTAESLGAAEAALAADVEEPSRRAAIRGPYHAGQAPTDGCAAVVGAATETLPTTGDELNLAVTGASLIHLSCHGIFDWAQPLSSYLQLGFNLPVADLFDRVELPPGAAVLLGTCDSGTVAQTDLNEGIGIPAGLLAAGAATVVGAGWPVARVAAVAICRKVVEGLDAGYSSPEALRKASLWLRDATGADVLTLLQAIQHPLAEPLAAQAPDFLARQPFGDPWVWSAYLHWGAPWKAARSGNGRAAI
jgi:CHAT domain